MAKRAELHEMVMDGDVMRMRAIDNLSFASLGTRVSLKPGGHHLMLVDLSSRFPDGSVIPVTC